MSKNPSLSIVVSAYKEEKRLRATLPEFLKFARNSKQPVELVFVDDGSPDGTAKVIEDSFKGIKGTRFIRSSVNQGKGAGIRRGMLSARGKFRLFADADNATPVPQADKLLKEADEETVVIGSRYVPGAVIEKSQPLYRVFGSRVLNFFAQLILLPGIKDTQCGFKLFPERAVGEIFPKLRLTRWSFDLEVLALARKLGYRIKEVPVEWEDDPRSVLHPFRDGFRFLLDVIRIKIHLMRGDYD